MSSQLQNYGASCNYFGGLRLHAMYAKVRRLYLREQLLINEIKRQTSLSRNTIKKWIKEDEGVEPKYARPKATSKITPYESRLQLATQTDSHRPKRDRRTELMLFKEIQK
jgi:hypothetical protein